tara:strand:- start:753 stop:965 length:213 start_codon:yes stop_codon:yes gene_type:complete
MTYPLSVARYITLENRSIPPEKPRIIESIENSNLEGNSNDRPKDRPETITPPRAPIRKMSNFPKSNPLFL